MRQRAFRAHLEVLFLFATASCPKMHRSLRDFQRDILRHPFTMRGTTGRRQLNKKQSSGIVLLTFPNIQIHPTVGKHVNATALQLCRQPCAVPFSKALTQRLLHRKQDGTTHARTTLLLPTPLLRQRQKSLENRQCIPGNDGTKCGKRRRVPTEKSTSRR